MPFIARLDKSRRRVLCRYCARPVAYLTPAPHRVYLMLGMAFREREGWWEESKHSRERRRRGQRPQGRRVQESPVVNWSKAELEGAVVPHPSPMTLPAHVKCPFCHAINVLNPAGLNGARAAGPQCLVEDANLPCLCCNGARPPRRVRDILKRLRVLSASPQARDRMTS